MKIPPFAPTEDKAFTLLELLVVISIIAVLAGILLPVAGSVTTNARKVQAKNTEVQVITAIKAFQTDYGTYPLPTTATVGADACIGQNNPTNAQLCDILRANGQPAEMLVNTRGVQYIQLPDAKMSGGVAKNGIRTDGMLVDPWGTVFLIGIDGNYDGTLPNPYGQNAGPVVLRTDVIVYSYGPDKQSNSNFYGPGGDKNVGINADDVISWQ